MINGMIILFQCLVGINVLDYIIDGVQEIQGNSKLIQCLDFFG